MAKREEQPEEKEEEATRRSSSPFRRRARVSIEGCQRVTRSRFSRDFYDVTRDTERGSRVPAYTSPVRTVLFCFIFLLPPVARILAPGFASVHGRYLSALKPVLRDRRLLISAQEVPIASAFTRHAKFLAAPSRVLPIDSHARPPTKSLARAADPIYALSLLPVVHASPLFIENLKETPATYKRTFCTPPFAEFALSFPFLSFRFVCERGARGKKKIARPKLRVAKRGEQEEKTRPVS